MTLFLLLLAVHIQEAPSVSQQDDRISQWIQQLGADKLKMREEATDELIKIGTPAKPLLEQAVKGDTPEVRSRAEPILKVIAVKERVKFSEGLLKDFPNLYRDLAQCKDASEKFEILQKITELDEQDKPKHEVANDNLAEMIGEILSGGCEELSMEQELTICAIVVGKIRPTVGATDTGRQIEGGWHEKIPHAIKHIRKLLKEEENGWVRLYAVEVLGEVGAKEALEDMRPFLKSDDYAIRGRTAESFAKLGAKEGIEDLKPLLNDKHWYPQECAASALRKLGLSDEEIEKAKNEK